MGRYLFPTNLFNMSEADKHNSPEHSELISLVYQDLRLHAQALINKEFNGVTFQATELANEAYLKLFNAETLDWKDPQKFMAAAVVVMRRYLVDHARKKTANKRIPEKMKQSLQEEDLFNLSVDDQILSLDDALLRLEQLDARQAKVVELRFFAGMTETEIADILGVSRRTISEEWKIAKMWLKHDVQNH
ncbi:ECF-type sigma factor [Marinicella sp. W31]|uniref:ECF-type sigma factor n=1 Tax=Marinicella sp. W31 TaxID=3023713 RepID=UPI00375729C4